MALADNGYVHAAGILNNQQLETLRSRFDAIVAENASKLQSVSEVTVKTIPANMSFDFAVNKERTLVDNVEYYETNGDKVLFCIHDIETLYPDVDEFFRANICKNPKLLAVSVPGTSTHYKTQLVKKSNNDNHVIDWHRDCPFNASNPMSEILLGVYLDDSVVGRDAVNFLKGSHLVESPSFDSSKIETVAAKAGDATIHFGSTYHESPNSDQPFTRRTIYYRFKFVPAA